MDAPRTSDPAGRRSPPPSSPVPRAVLRAAALALSVLTLPGCSFFVMGGKMLLGIPEIPSPFRQATGVDLTDGTKTVLFVCSTPYSMHDHRPDLRFELMEGVARRMERRGISVVDPGRVADWMDSRGWSSDGPSELARAFDVDYILQVDLDSVSYYEENSKRLLRGRARGSAFGYEVRSVGGTKEAFEVFVKEFDSVHPPHHPVSVENTTERVFAERFVDTLCTRLGQLFYDSSARERAL